MRRISTALGLAALVLTAGSAAAQSRVEVGVLSCRGATQSFVIGSRTDLNCAFRRADGRVFHYRAAANRLGVDLGVGQTTRLEWAVYAPTRRVGRHDLSGSYGGVSAGASVGIGLGANALLGGSNNTIALQPLSVQGQTGLGVAAGIAGLRLG
jgi:Protein of unknown function (DUF992)